MADCRSCRSELPERGFHCPACGLLVRCRKCGDILELDARFCVNCGISTEESEMTAGFNDGRGKSVGSTHNVVEFEEDTRSRRFRASVSDRAIDSISEPLAFFLANRNGEQFKRRRRPSAGGVDSSQSSLPGFTKEAEIVDTGTTTNTENPSESSLPPERREAEQLGKIFHRNTDGQLRLMNSRLKQNSQSDFVIRLSVLFLHAHATAGEEMVLREKLNKILKDAKVYDGNARKWIANADLLSHDEDSIGLSLPGRERAEEVLREVADPNIDTKWTLGSRTSGQKAKNISEKKKGKVGDKRRTQGDSYQARVRKLIDEDFFNKERSSEEVKKELKRQGFEFTLGRINAALKIYTQKEKLSRDEIAPNKWRYKNKSKS